MSIRPIDLQVLVPKTVDVGKIQQTIKDNTDAQQNLLAAQFQQQLHSAKQKVVKKSKSDYIEFETDKKDQKQKRQNKKKKGPEEGETNLHRKKQSHIDVTI